MTRVLLLCRYARNGASSRLRTLQFLPPLERRGFQVDVCPFFDERYLEALYAGRGRREQLRLQPYLRRLRVLFGAARYDVVWIEKEIFPYLPALAEHLLARRGIPLVVDYDDAVFHRYQQGNRLVRQLLGDKLASVMRSAATVVCGNAYIAGYARAQGARAVVEIPTVVDLDRYRPVSPGLRSPPVIGWIGSPSTEQYLLPLRAILLELCRQGVAELLLVGVSEQLANEFRHPGVSTLPWSEQSEADSLARMDIGIMPLRDAPFERGKCGYKLIQYMACGLPVVASPVGVNVQIVGENDCGILAATADDWRAALDELVRSPDRRIALGRAGRCAVERQYNVAVQLDRIARVLADPVQAQAAAG